MSLIGTGNPVGRPSGTGKDKGGDTDILTLMRQRFEHVSSVDSENRDSYVQNTTISSSNNQWDEEVKKRRGANRPALTFNLLNGVVKQIIGDYRQNKLAIKILPSGGAATEDVADILAGLIRSIETDSNADHAYTNALECSARGGFGYFRIISEYEADDVFNQKLVIKPIYNPLTVYFDPAAKRITREDAQYCLITEMMPKDEFKRQYPEAEENGWDIIDVTADNMEEWGDDNEIRVCEYFVKESVSERLVAFDNGAVVSIDNEEEIEALEQIGWKVTKERKANRINIKWYKCNGSHVLEKRTFKTKYIPIIPVLGEEVNVEGKTLLRSAVYYGIDAQHSYNYERSTAVERSALAAKAPWIVTQKQIELYRDQWDGANTTPQPYLVHTPDPAMPNGPQRIEPPSPSGADMQNAQVAAQDVQRTTLVFNAQLGEQSNVQSGVGLSEQQSQGATSTFIFPDNLRTGIEYGGRILIDWIPFVYDKERVIRTINSEDEIDMQTVNEQQGNPLLAVTEVLNDITVGKYDVVVTAGKAFASRRREAVDGMMKFAQNFPQQAPLIADLMVDNMDIPGGEVMAARLKRALPPQVVNDPDSPEGQATAQQAQQQEQMKQGLMQQHLQNEQGKLLAEQGKNQASMVKSQAEVVKAHADVIAATEDTKSKKIDTALQVLDAARTGQEGQSSQPRLRTKLGSRKEDVDRANQEHDKDMQNSEEIKQMLGQLTQHVVKSHEVHHQQTATTHQLMSHLAQSHQQIGQALQQQNAIAAAPTEAVRDKNNKIIGSRKIMPNPAA